jgi:choline-sulfatase
LPPTASFSETAFSQATETRPSCPTLMTSLYPTSTGVWNFTDRLNERYITLAEVLRSQGFETAAFIQNNHAGRVAGLHRGYNHFYEKYSLDSGPAGIYSERMTDWLEGVRDRNFFLYLHVLDPHDPYDPPAEFDVWSGEPSRENFGFAQQGFELDRSKYDGEILANDHYFGKFVDRLEAWACSKTPSSSSSATTANTSASTASALHVPPAFAQVLHVPLMMRYPKSCPRNRGSQLPWG